MSHRQNPPRQSPAARKRSPVTAHAGKPSVGHNVGTRKAKTILSKTNGDPLGVDGSGNAPGANGPPTTGQ
jgi:hypothetical protein